MRNFKALLLTGIAVLMAANPVIAQTQPPANPAKPVAPTPTGQDQSAPAIQLTAQQFQQFLQAIGNIGKAQQAASSATPVPPAQSPPAANVPANVAATQPVAPPTPTPAPAPAQVAAQVNNTPPAAPSPGAKPAASSGGGTLTVTSTSSGQALTIGGAAVQPANVSNSADNYYDDGLKWSVDVQGWSNPYTTPTADLCIPANTRMLGRSTTPVTTATVTSSVVDNAKANATANKANGTASASATTNKFVEVQLNPTPYLFGFVTGPQEAVPAGQACQGGPDGKTAAIGKGQTFYVSYGDLQNVDYRSGWDYGALVIPFKAQMSSKKAISGSASLGGYLGYRMPFQNIGFTVSPIIFAGISSISTSVSSSATPATGSNSSNTSSQTLAALTYGGGMVWQIKNSSFQVGMLLGFDHVDSLQPYTYNDKPWLSIEVGYSFAQ